MSLAPNSSLKEPREKPGDDSASEGSEPKVAHHGRSRGCK